MKIAVFHCPSGITGEGVIQAFLDAGLPQNFLQRKLNQKRLDPKLRVVLSRLSRQMGGIGISGKDAVEALRCVAGAKIGLDYFGIKKCFVRQVAIGRKGNPRTLKLLTEFVLDRLPAAKELVTPSGAAILASFCERAESIPAMRLEGVGFGPSHLIVSFGETVVPYRRERILLLETNIDDITPQAFELIYEKLFKAGALDVWVQPILMKKTRPAFKLSVLFRHADQGKISEEIFKETPTLGVRFLELDRFSLPRQIKRVRTRFGAVRMKVGWLNSHPLGVSPEYDDVKRIARRTNLPFQKVRQVIIR